MSQTYVERVIGLLATDESLRRSFAKDPSATIQKLSERGIELTRWEQFALASLDPEELSQFAELLESNDATERLVAAYGLQWINASDPVVIQRIQKAAEREPEVTKLAFTRKTDVDDGRIVDRVADAPDHDARRSRDVRDALCDHRRDPPGNHVVQLAYVTHRVLASD